MTRDSSRATSDDAGIPSDQLLNAVSQLLVATRRQQSRPDRLYANELAMQMIKEMDERSLTKTAQLIAKMAEAPEELQRELAFSSLPGAEIILSSRHTGDAVLMEAASKDIEYRKIVAKRPTLSEPVVNRLLFHEETEIENILLPRTEIPLSKNRLQRLVNRASSRMGLATLLTKRSDLNARLSLRLFWALGTDGRRAVLEKFNVDPGFAADVFTQVLGTKPEAYGDTPLGKMAQLITRAQAFEKAGRSQRGPAPFDPLVISMRTSGSREVIGEAAKEGLVSEALVTRIVQDGGGEPLTVFAAAMNASEKGFNKMLGERAGSETKQGPAPFDGKDRKRLERLFQSLNPAAAAAILSYWDIDLNEERRDRSDNNGQVDMSNIEARLKAAFDTDNQDPVIPSEVADKGATETEPVERKKRSFFAGGRR